jgi:hypothetical protein
MIGHPRIDIAQTIKARTRADVIDRSPKAAFAHRDPLINKARVLGCADCAAKIGRNRVNVKGRMLWGDVPIGYGIGRIQRIVFKAHPPSLGGKDVQCPRAGFGAKDT